MLSAIIKAVPLGASIFDYGAFLHNLHVKCIPQRLEQPFLESSISKLIPRIENWNLLGHFLISATWSSE